MVIQDDAQPCLGFTEVLPTIAAKHLDTPVCLFMGDIPAGTAIAINRMLAAHRRKPYVPLSISSFVPLVAVLWPRHKAQAFLAWSQTSRRMTRADDHNASRWMKAERQQFMVTVPSLVEHDDYVPSVKGGRDHVFGQESWRRALHLAEDATQYDW